MKKERGAGAVVVFFGIILVLLIVGVVLILMNSNNETAKVEADVTEMFKTLQTGEIDNNLDMQSLNENEVMSMKVLTSNLSYSIVSKEVNGEEATVVMDITNKDMKQVLGYYMMQAYSIAMTNALHGDASEEELNKQFQEKFQEIINSDQVELKTTRVTLKMQKKDGKWKVKEESGNDLLNAVLPGFQDAVSGINNLFQEN